MNFDLDIAKFGLTIVNTVATGAAFIYTFIATRDKDNSTHIKAVEDTLSKAIALQSSRLDKIETHITNAPSPKQFYDLQSEVREIAATQESIKSDSRATREAVTRIESYLINRNI